MIDPKKLRPGELCRLLNSTPLGEVIADRHLRRHREQAGLRLGDGRHIDLLRYVAWLVHVRHVPKPGSEDVSSRKAALAEAAQGAAAQGSRRKQLKGHGQRLTNKQEALIAALLTESTNAAAAAKAGVGQTTLYRWMQLPAFSAAYREARRGLMEATVGRLQAASGETFEILLAVARTGRRDSDRVRAAVALLDRARAGCSHADALHGEPPPMATTPMATGDVVQVLSTRLRQLEAADLPTSEKARLTATLADAVLRALGVDVLDKRLEAIQAVLLGRKEKKR
jgi:transposase